MFADDALYDQLVLKGGNALSVVYKIGKRTSLDLDFSVSTDFKDIEDIKRRIYYSLATRFDEVGFVVFDERFEDRRCEPNWGGYTVAFKLIEKEKFRELRTLDDRRRNATLIGAADKRVFTIQISRFEFCEGAAHAEIDAFDVLVYTPAMIAIEKVRAICQQMESYVKNMYKTPRARDFYDIFCICNERGIDLGSHANLELFTQIFLAKDVPLALIQRISECREFHRADWESVRNSVSGNLAGFDFYFDFLITSLAQLESLWVE